MSGHVLAGHHVSHVSLAALKSHSFPLDSPEHIPAEVSSSDDDDSSDNLTFQHHPELEPEGSEAGDKRRRWGGTRAEAGRGAARQR